MVDCHDSTTDVVRPTRFGQHYSLVQVLVFSVKKGSRAGAGIHRSVWRFVDVVWVQLRAPTAFPFCQDGLYHEAFPPGVFITATGKELKRTKWMLLNKSILSKSLQLNISVYHTKFGLKSSTTRHSVSAYEYFILTHQDGKGAHESRSWRCKCDREYLQVYTKC